MNAVIYARYSSDRQTEQSIEGQLRECYAFAEENDIKIIGTYIDRAKSGRNDNRLEFQKMIHDSKNKHFDAVIVWKIDRFGRNREDIAKNKAILRRNGVKVLYAKEHIPDGAEGIILEGLLESLAEYYSAELREKIIRGMRESAYKCRFNGSGLATGYCVDSEHRFHIDKNGAAIVHMIFDMYESGKTVAEILRTINDKGLKTIRGNKWTHYGVTRVLKNRQYIGEYRWNDIVIPGGMPRIISDEQFEKVNAELEKSKKAPARKRDEDSSFLLTGKIFCGHCKGTMIGDSGTGKRGNKFYYYTCRARKTRHTCSKASVKKEWIENEVVRLTAETVLQDDVIEYIATRVVEIQKKERDDKSMLDYLNGRLTETQNAIRNIMKAIEAGIITETTGARLRELEDEREGLKAEIERQKLLMPVIEREQVVYFLQQFKCGRVDDKQYQRQLIDMFVNKVFLYDDKIIITYNYSGNNNELTAEIVEEAAEEALFGNANKCSDALQAGPPNKLKANPFPLGDGFAFIVYF